MYLGCLVTSNIYKLCLTESLNAILQVEHLCEQIMVSKASLEETLAPPPTSPTHSGFASFFNMSGMFSDTSKAYGDMSTGEVKKLVSHLEQAHSHLAHAFGVGLHCIYLIYLNNNNSFFCKTPSTSPCFTWKALKDTCTSVLIITFKHNGFHVKLVVKRLIS